MESIKIEYKIHTAVLKPNMKDRDRLDGTIYKFGETESNTSYRFTSDNADYHAFDV